MFIYTKIIDYLTFLIQQNKDNESFLLPSENQLCAKFSASRVSVRKALDHLKQQELIYSVKGKGYFINANNPILNKNNHHKKLSLSFITTASNNRHRLNILNGINQFCDQNNIRCMTFYSYNDPLLEQNKLHDAINIHSDGIILFPSDSNIYSAELFKLLNYNIPIILIDRNLQGLGLPCISSNHFDMAYRAIEWFHNKKIKDIVYITHQKDLSSAVQERQKGIQQGLLDFMGRINKHNLMYDDIPPEELYQFYYDYFKRHPEITGIIYSTSENLQYLLKALEDLNKKINEDIYLVFIDEEYQIPFGQTSQRIPMIIQDGVSMGYTAAKTLLKMIHTATKVESKYIPVKYINWD